MGKALDTVNAFLQNQDVTVLAENFKFIGPVDQTTGLEEFGKLNEAFTPHIAGMRMLSQFENGDQVVSIYEMDLNAPSGKAITLKVSDWVKVENGKMVEERIFYDPREFIAEFK